MMQDEHTWELLSRYADGDLPPAEAAALEQRLAADADLRRELAGILEMRDLLRQSAEAEAAPAVLDELVEPLRRSLPPRRSVRPAIAWLAAAATLVLGVTVGVEVFHRRPGPELESMPGAPAARPTPYLLRPLPTRGDDAPEGALERLLASPVPQPRVGKLTPVPPEGPTDVAPRTAEESKLAAGERQAQQSMADELSSPPRPVRERGADRVQAGAVAAPKSKAQAAAPRARVLVGGGAPLLEVRLAADSELRPGDYAVVLTVDARGVIVAAAPQGATGEEPVAGLRSGCQLLVGSHVAGLTPGRHGATLVVE